MCRYTREVEIKFAVYNGYVGMFTFVKISFKYALTGAFVGLGRKGGSMVTIKTISMEPYRIGA